jgi:hypothetical protein
MCEEMNRQRVKGGSEARMKRRQESGITDWMRATEQAADPADGLARSTGAGIHLLAALAPINKTEHDAGHIENEQ